MALPDGQKLAIRSSSDEAPNPHLRVDDDIRLVDVVTAIIRRRRVLAACIILGLLVGGGIVLFAPKEYEASAAFVPLAQDPLQKSWLGSRAVAASVVDSFGERLYPEFFGKNWNAETRTLAGGGTPSRDDLAAALQLRVRQKANAADHSYDIVVKMTDPVLARDVAAAYLASLETIRPQLEALERAALFDGYYNGQGRNLEEARQLAEEGAKAEQYWLVFDQPTIPHAPLGLPPSVILIAATASGVLVGLLAVFTVEWFVRYRDELKASLREGRTAREQL